MGLYNTYYEIYIGDGKDRWWEQPYWNREPYRELKEAKVAIEALLKEEPNQCAKLMKITVEEVA